MDEDTQKIISLKIHGEDGQLYTFPAEKGKTVEEFLKVVCE